MANDEHLKILKQGVATWNQWKKDNPDLNPDLSGGDLSGANLSGVNLEGVSFHKTNLSGADLKRAYLPNSYFGYANLSGADFSGADVVISDFHNANLSGANFSGAGLIEANFADADLSGADFSGASLGGARFFNADLSGANLNGSSIRDADVRGARLQNAATFINADLTDSNFSGVNFNGSDLSGANLQNATLDGADLSGANLNGASLIYASFVETKLNGATLNGAHVYGLSVWGIEREGLIQNSLVITKPEEPEITVDNLEMAQFIYLMLNNKNIRDVIDTLTSKSVLILGRFTEDRKKVLDAIKEELRQRNYLPILFDFDKPASRDLTETISILAKMARFVIADLTDARSIPQELSYIVPVTPSLPVMPIILAGQREYAMFEHFKPYPWVLPLHAYETPDVLLAEIVQRIIEPAERKVEELKR